MLILIIVPEHLSMMMFLSRSKLNVPSPSTSTQWENTSRVHNDLYTDDDTTDDTNDDVIKCSTLKEVCIQLAELRDGLPTCD